MKNSFLCTAVLIAGLTIVSFHTNSLHGQTTQSKIAMKDTMKYTCPHHPDVISDKPGKCACGMELVAMKSAGMKKDKMMKKDGMMQDSKDMKQNKMMKDTAMMKKKKMQ